MHNMIKAISFDFGGTLAAPDPPHTTLLKNALLHLKKDISSETIQQVIREVDLGYAEYLPETLQEEHDCYQRLIHRIITITHLRNDHRITNAINNCFNLQKLNFTVYPDTTPTLRALKKMKTKMCIVSNFWPSLQHILSRLKLKDFFEAVISSSKTGYAKPDKRIFDIAMHELQVTPDEIIHVGNEQDDIIGAEKAGIVPVVVNRNNIFQYTSKNIKNLHEIIALLQ